MNIVIMEHGKRHLMTFFWNALKLVRCPQCFGHCMWCSRHKIRCARCLCTTSADLWYDVCKKIKIYTIYILMYRTNLKMYSTAYTTHMMLFFWFSKFKNKMLRWCCLAQCHFDERSECLLGPHFYFYLYKFNYQTFSFTV